MPNFGPSNRIENGGKGSFANIPKVLTLRVLDEGRNFDKVLSIDFLICCYNQIQMEAYPVYGFINSICLVGHGSIGKGTLPLLKRHFKYDKIVVIDPHPVCEPETDEKVSFWRLGLTKDNF